MRKTHDIHSFEVKLVRSFNGMTFLNQLLSASELFV